VTRCHGTAQVKGGWVDPGRHGHPDGAYEKVERARTEVRIAELRIDSSVRSLPLREQVADSERVRRADAVLAAA